MVWLTWRVNYFTYDYNGEESDIDYDLNLELKSFGLFADVHPFKQAFRISAGFLINGNEFSGNGKITGTSFEIGDVTYNSAKLNLSVSTSPITLSLLILE